MSAAEPSADERERWLPADLWILAAFFAAILFIQPGDSLLSGYAIRWYAVAFVLIAVGGRRHRWLGMLAAALAGVAGLYELVATVRSVATYVDWSVWPYAVGGVVVVALSAYQVLRLARGGGVDPVHLAAIQLALGAVARWAFELVSGHGVMASLYAPTTAASPFRTELPYVALALAAVGLGVSRAPRQSLLRLGLVVPTWWQPVLAVLVATLLAGSAGLSDVLTYRFEPNTYWAITAVEGKVNSQMTMTLALVVALLAGIGEETFFRGALQPRIGILAASLLFAAIHIQYAFTPILAMVFVHGIVYGLLRHYMNTTTAITAHVAYDCLAALTPSRSVLNSLVLITGIVLVILLIRSWRKVLRALDGISTKDLIGFTLNDVRLWPLTARVHP